MTNKASSETSKTADFGWSRYVTTRGAHAAVDESGFLIDPGSVWNYRNTNLKHFHDLDSFAFIALLGVPGIGKSRSLRKDHQRIADQGADGLRSTLWFDLSVFSTDGHLVDTIFNNEKFVEHRRDDKTLILFLDSLDECQLNVKSVAQLLARELQAHFWSGLMVRISCRTAVWPALLQLAADNLWPNSSITAELQPLCRGNVKSAALLVGIDAEEFLKAIERSRVGPFAARPVTLQFLLNLYANARDLPRSRRELYSSGLQTLADELSDSRRASGYVGQLTIQDRLNLAQSIAAITVFCNQNQIWTGAHSNCPPDYISVDRLADAVNTLGLHFQCSTPDAIREVLDTGLFMGRGVSRVAWAHESYREYFSARFLADRCQSRRQLESLIRNSHDPDRKVAPQLFGTVGWLYEFSPEVRNHINADQPELILQSDMDIDPAIPREPLVGAIMHLVEKGRLFDADWASRRRYAKLAHEKLHHQLSPFIRNKAYNVVARRIAIDIIQACEERGAISDLAAVALDKTDDIVIRERSALAITHLAAPEGCECLRAFIEDPVGTAATDDLIGIALDSLWPAQLSSEQLFASVHTPLQEHHFGSYRSFIGTRLPEEIQKADVLQAINWFANSASERPDLALEPLQRAVLRYALASCESAEVCRTLGEALWCHVRKFSQVFDRRGRDDAPWEIHPATGRQQLLLEVARHIQKPEIGAGTLSVSSLCILRPAEDFEFLLDEFSICQTQPLRETIGQLLCRVVQMHTTTDRIERIIHRCGIDVQNRDSELAHIFRWLVEPMIIDSAEADRAREVLQAQRNLANRPIPGKLDPPPPERIQYALERIEGGEIAWWDVLLAQLSLKEDSTTYGHVGTQVFEQPGWIHANPATRDRIARAALAFIGNYRPRSDLSSVTNQWRSSDEGPLVALLVVQVHAPQLYHNIDATTLAQLFAPLLCIPWDRETDKLGDSLRRAFDADVMGGEAFAIDRLALAVREPFLRGTLDKIDIVWNAALLNAATQVLQDPQNSKEGFADLLRRFLIREPASGVAIAMRLLAQPPRPELEPIVLSVLMNNGLAEAWHTLWPIIASNDFLATAAMLETSTSEEALYNQFQRLSPDKLALVYARLQALFPAAADLSVVGYVLPRHIAARIREAALGILSRLGTFEACQVIDQLAQADPASLHLKYTLAEATNLARATTWETPSVEMFAHMLADNNKRLVRNAQELALTVLEMLDALQDRVQGANKPVTQYWDERQGDQRPKTEGRMADNVRDYLDSMLRARGTIVNREVEVRNLPGTGVGERTDLLISAASRSEHGVKGDVAEVVVECKGCWNAGLFNDMQVQLRDRYLRGSGYKSGIYLVGWFFCPAWNSADSRFGQAKSSLSATTIDELRNVLALQAQSLSSAVKIASYVLDLSLT